MSYQKLGEEIGKLVEEKQQAYGDSFSKSGRILKELFPNGVNPDQYDDLLTIARIIDKLFRIANDKNAFGESPYRDIAGYALLGTKKDESKSEWEEKIEELKPNLEKIKEDYDLNVRNFQAGQEEYFRKISK